MAIEKLRKDIEALKRNWYKDPIFDLEDTEGFEAHREELKQFSKESKEHWKKLAQEKHDRLAAKVCFMSFGYTRGKGSYDQDVIEFEWRGCLVEQCAAWDSDRECCGMLPYKEVVISGGINTHQY